VKTKDPHIERAWKQWFEFGCPPNRWAKLKHMAAHRDVWVFAKGASFNKDFNWDVCTRGYHLRVAVNDAALYVPSPHLVVTIDHEIRQYLWDEGYKDVTIGHPHPEHADFCCGSGHFCFRILRMLGVKELTEVGFDLIFRGENTQGFDYQFKNNPDLAEVSKQRLMKACLYELRDGGIEVKHYKRKRVK